MLPVLSRQQSREFDRHASASCGVPGLSLMENAGRGAADWLLQHWVDNAPVQIVCGPGNNGGDGWVVGRRLLVAGRQVHVHSTVEPGQLRGDAAAMCAAYRACGGAWSMCSEDAREIQPGGASIYVDALYGTGLTRALQGKDARWIEALNAAGGRILALDLPSGLDADTGQLHGGCVRATATVAFAHSKWGLETPNGVEVAGSVQVVDIGVPSAVPGELGPVAVSVEARDVKSWLSSVRGGEAPRHKAEAGSVFVLAGSPGSPGAAKLVARGALRAGAGLVTMGARADVQGLLASSLWESMLRPLHASDEPEVLGAALNKIGCLAVGPGLGLDAVGQQLARNWVLRFPGRVVVDADALTHFAADAKALRSARGSLMLTPHPAEAARLLGTSTAAIEANRFESVRQLADVTGAVVLLKGVRTLVCAPGEMPWVNRSGHAALATAGSGDVLSGMVAALACRLEPRLALAASAWIHGKAGEALGKLGRGALAREIADAVPACIAAL